MNFTHEQQAAIVARGQVIVSASAGSGKTAVMIERLVSLILGGADVKKVLAVTFTNKAAAQMREKLRGALIKRIATASADEKARLKEQLSALPVADICTIHAFCGRLVRANFFLAGTDTNFRIIAPDDAEGSALQARAIDEAFEEAYEEGSEEFSRLLNVYFRKKKDARLRTIVQSLYRVVRGLPDYRERLLSAGKEDAFEEVCAYLFADICARTQAVLDEVEELSVYFAEHNAKAFTVCGDIVKAGETLLGAGSLFACKELPTPLISRMPPKTKATGEELEGLLRLAACSSAIKELYGEVGKYASREEEYARYLDGNVRASALCALVLKYDEIYARFKREKGVLDYNDLEHCAVRVLSDADCLKGVRERCEYLFVDEYQDVNLAQEKILSLVGGEEVFLVGDRKQAIYGFRGSKSEYFTQKTREYPTALVLSENFRSASAVLDGVNRVFTGAMVEESCGFSYAPDSVMRGGRRYGAHEGGVQFHRVKKEEKEKNPPKEVYSVLNASREIKTDGQAEEIVRIVLNEIGTEWFDADAEEGKQIKRVSYGDIAVLVRKTTGDAERTVAALSARNIPVTTTAKVNICTFWEIKLLTDWLSYLDNAEQDIPLVSAMLSQVGGFCEEELAQIKLRFPSAYFFRDACREYAQKMANGLAVRLKEFFARVEDLRVKCAVLPVREVLCSLLAMGLEREIAAKKDGALRLRRVRRLLDEAEGSTHEFLSKLRRADYHIDFSEGGGEDAVKVITMHASKGLEYPVVILSSLDAPFHGAEKDDVMYTEKFFVAPRSFDSQKKLVYDTVLRRASAIYQEREGVKDELNLLYVAMTRARYRLHMLFGEREAISSVRYAKRFSDFINFKVCQDYFVESEEAERESMERKALSFRADEELTKEILSYYQKGYAYQESVSVPVKSSATELMQTQKTVAIKATGNEGRTAEEGTAYHAFLQHVRFGFAVEEELVRMKQEGLLTEEQLALLEVEKLKKLFTMSAFAEIGGGQVLREQKFLVSLPWSQLAEGKAADEVVFQGAIDMLLLDSDGATIFDYKYSSHDDERIKKDYALQISLYKKAVAKSLRIDEENVHAKILNILSCREITM